MCATVYGWHHLVKATEVTAGLSESNGSLYRREDGLKSPASRLPVQWDQLRAQRSVTSMEEVYLLTIVKSKAQTFIDSIFVHFSRIRCGHVVKQLCTTNKVQ